MLDELTKESFLPHLDSVFRLSEPALELRLVEVEARWGKGPKREPFSLHFLGSGRTRAAAEDLSPRA